jgi:protein-disulfide isomerase
MDLSKKITRFGLIALMGLLVACSENKPNPELVDIEFNSNPILGSEDAPVQLIIFADFECTYCKQLVGYLDGAAKNHIASGKLSAQIWDFPLDIHEHAFSAAICAFCASHQGNYWEMHSLLYESQNAMTVDSFRQFAILLGLDIDSFNVCFASDSARNKIQSDILIGEKIGVEGTPAFILNGNRYSGTPPEDVFLELINSELEKLY